MMQQPHINVGKQQVTQYTHNLLISLYKQFRASGVPMPITNHSSCSLYA